MNASIRINDTLVLGDQVAFDGCHKLYVIEDEGDLAQMVECEYDIHPIQELPALYAGSCPLRFIMNAKLDKTYVDQFEDDEPVFTTIEP